MTATTDHLDIYYGSDTAAILRLLPRDDPRLQTFWSMCDDVNDYVMIRESQSAAILRDLFPPPRECEVCNGNLTVSVQYDDYSEKKESCLTCNATGRIFAAPTIDPRWLSSTVLDLARTIRGREAGWYCQSCNKECGTADFWCYCGDKASRSKSQAVPPDLDPARFGVLADALIEAYCDDKDIITHLMRPEPHTEHCWAIKLITGG